MGYEEKRTVTEAPHGLTLEDRRRLVVSGVTEVESFNEQEVIVSTTQGMLSVRGGDLHMDKLSVDTGDVVVTGCIDSLDYQDAPVKGESFFSRLFR